MKRILLSVALCSTVFLAHAQQDPQYTHNMFDRLSVNPGSAGVNDAICATAIYRTQWVSFDGAPKTLLFNLQGPVKLAHGGLGLTVFSDQLGQEKNLIVRGAYSYHQAAGPGILGIGVAGGIINKSLTANWIATDGYLNDVAIPDAGVSTTTYDMTFGLYYNIKNRMYVGLSSTHLAANPLEDLGIDLSRHYYIQAGYNYEIEPNKWSLLPSVFAKTDAASTQIDLNVRVLYNNMVWAGVSYRTADAIAPMVGFQRATGENGNGMIKIGYSYDVTTSQLNNYSSGSHEIMLNYCFKLDSPPKIQKYKNVRFL